MNFQELNHLKTLSWYTTVPLLVCAWMLQDFSSFNSEALTLWLLIAAVSTYFVKVLFGLMFLYIAWLYASAYLEPSGLPLTLLLATYMLTVAGAGIGIYFLKPQGIELPVNIVWFIAIASVAFNLYQIHSSIIEDHDAHT